MKKRLLKATPPPTASEPMAMTVMAPVIVWPGRQGLMLKTAPPTPPAAMATIMVSPMARREGHDERGHDARDRRRDHHADAGGALRGAEPVGGLAQVAGAPRTCASSEIEATSGVTRMPTADAGAREREGQGVAAQAAGRRRGAEDGEGEEAEDHAGDRGQDLEDGLEPRRASAGWRTRRGRWPRPGRAAWPRPWR